jgi:hypothetical protein
MTHDAEEKALNHGHQCAMSAIAEQKSVLANLSPGERLSWWIGFISAGMGASIASVGEPAMQVLKDALAERPTARSPAVRRTRTYLKKRTS